MARGRADTAARLANFKAGLARIADEADVIVGADELAQMAGMTRVQLVTYYINTDPAFPIIDRGGPGKPYRIDAKAALAHMIGRMEAQAEELKRQAEGRQSLVGLRTGSETPEVASWSDIKQQIEAVRQIERLRAEQRNYVPAAEHENVIRALFEIVTQTILSDRSRQDPTGRWSAEESARHDDMGRNLILEIERRVMQFFEELDANDPADESADQRQH